VQDLSKVLGVLGDAKAATGGANALLQDTEQACGLVNDFKDLVQVSQCSSRTACMFNQLKAAAAASNKGQGWTHAAWSAV
jgi:hypothetical protein